MLLKVGRHIRPAPHFKLIVSREEGENRYLEGYRKRFTTLKSISHEGPLCLVDGQPGPGDIALAARVVARYGQGRNAPVVTVAAEEADGRRRELRVAPLTPPEIPVAWHCLRLRKFWTCAACSARCRSSGPRTGLPAWRRVRCLMYWPPIREPCRMCRLGAGCMDISWSKPRVAAARSVFASRFNDCRKHTRPDWFRVTFGAGGLRSAPKRGMVTA